MSLNDKLTEDKKAQIILLMTKFIQNLDEDDTLFIAGESQKDALIYMTVHAEKKID